MRQGDHCVVGVNLLHKLWRWSDATCNMLTSWGVVTFYHHFVLVDSVASISETGEPLRWDGKPCRVAEFSDTVAGAWSTIARDGYRPLTLLRHAFTYLRAPAKLHLPPLNDYLPLDGRGVFVVAQQLTTEQRRQTADAALALVAATPESKPSYQLFKSNCEHVAWMLDPTLRRWVSPQVPHNLWILFRLLLQTISLGWLVVLHVADHQRTWVHALAASAYHLLSTVPVGTQAHVCLVRKCVNLTRRQSAGQISR